MNSVVILTATYNHPSELRRLHESLCKQNDNNFTWIIVNDGSGESTEILLSEFKESCKFDIQIINKINGGKSAAINAGIDCLSSEVEFFVIVDDDEELFPDAVTKIREYVVKYLNTDCVAIHFNRQNEHGEIISAPLINKDFFMPYQQFKSEGRSADGYIGYFFKKIGATRFTLYKNEKYIGPSTLLMKVTDHGRVLWANAVLGQTEYLAGGITKQGRKLRVKNPNGMIEYCGLMQSKESSLSNRIKYSIMGYAYAYLGGIKSSNGEYIKKLNRMCYIPGVVLGFIWKRKYKSL